MKIGSLFTGYGGLDMAVAQVTGGQTVWVSDVDKGANKILAHRYPDVPNLGDITAVDFSTVEPVDILTGGFPCQDLSHAGKRAGLKEGTRSGLWSHMARAIKELNPRLVVVENVRGLLSADAPGDVEPCPWCVGDRSTVNLRALGVVLADLADLGFDAEWVGLRCADVGGCHGRFRVFLVAHPQDTDSSTGGERWLTAPRQETGRRSRADAGRSDREGTDGVSLLPSPRATDGTKGGPNQRGSSGDLMLPSAVQLLPTPTRRDHKDGPYVEAVEENALLGRVVWNLTERFGAYAQAVERWGKTIGRVSPDPTEPTGRDDAHRLSPRFVEWMMGLPEGWVTDVPGLSRNDQLKALGNGVVPQQASAALTHLLGRSS